jgi:hypothetical protein
MAKQTFTTGQVLLASQLTSLQQTAMNGGAASAKTASYTLVAADAGTAISMTSTSATTITVNTGLFSDGDTILIQNLGSGTCTITAGTATVNTAGSLILPQYDAGILKFVSASSAVFYDFIQVGATSPLTTKGDLYGFSTSDARIPIGANNTVLTADSNETLGLKWAAPAGSNLTVSELSSGNFTSAATLTFSSLSSYDTLILFLENVQFATQGSTVLARINNDTDANYNSFGGYFGDTSAAVLQTNQTSIGLSNALNVAYNENTRYMIKFYNCKAAGFTDYIVHAFTRSNGNSNTHTFQGQFRKAAAVSSLVITTGGGTNFSTGSSYVLMGG